MPIKSHREAWPVESRQSHTYVHGIGREAKRFTLCLMLEVTTTVPLPQSVLDEMCEYVDGTVKAGLGRRAEALTVHCAEGFDYEDMAYAHYELTKLTSAKDVQVRLGVECCTSNWPEDDPGLQATLDLELAKSLPFYLTNLTNIAANAVHDYYVSPSRPASPPSTGAEPQPDAPGAEPKSEPDVAPAAEDPFDQAVNAYAQRLHGLLGSLDGDGLEALLRGTIRLDPETAKGFGQAADMLLQTRRRFFGPLE